jgi:hypothetical protein
LPKVKWTEAEMAWFYANPQGAYAEFTNQFGSTRTYNAWRVKRGDLQLGRDGSPTPAVVTDNSRERDVNWREWAKWMVEGQQLRRKAHGSLGDEEARIEVATDSPVAFIILGDTHLGSWSTDVELLVRMTDEILSIPNLYVALVGDMAETAIKMRNVVEMGNNLLPQTEQFLVLSDWMLDFQDRILFATWCNHQSERFEAQSGYNPYADLYRKVARHYFNGIGYLTIAVNGIEYRIAASHLFRGRSEYNPCHSQVKHSWKQGPDRDILIAGDSHNPGILTYTQGRDTKLAVNIGSAQVWSGYAQRYFSLFTHPTFPVVVLDHEAKHFRAHWSVGEYLRASL